MRSNSIVSASTRRSSTPRAARLYTSPSYRSVGLEYPQVHSGIYTVYLTIIELTMWPCVSQLTPKTAVVTVTKIAVRVRILMNRCFFRMFGIHSFFVCLAFIVFTLRPLLHAGCTCTYTCRAHELCTRAEPCDWSAGAHALTLAALTSCARVGFNCRFPGQISGRINVLLFFIFVLCSVC